MAVHLAQSNIARMRGNIDDPVMAGFVARLESLNALADSSSGFVWRYQTDAGDATEIRVYKSDHVTALRKRAAWFERPSRAPLALWWILAGHTPSVEEAKERFEALWRDGASPFAFTFSERFPPPDA